MGIDYLVCDHCGEAFPDVCDHYYCDGCGRVFCSYCAEEAGLKFYDDEDCCCEVESCIYCRKEAFDDNALLNYLLKKYNITREDVEKELKGEK